MFDGSGVFLHPENPGHLGDDTFWTWFKREFPMSRWDWENATSTDVVLQYSVLGPYEGPAKYIALCWEMYPEMQATLPAGIEDWTPKVDRCLECSKRTPWRTVPTITTAHYYTQFGSVDIIPIGIDTEVFRPLRNKLELREKHGIPTDRKVCFWSGTNHHMKGFDIFRRHMALNPHVFPIVAWKQPQDRGSMPEAHESVTVLQSTLNELMNCADYFASTGRLKPMFMVEWEAMASGLEVNHINGVTREVEAGSSRSFVFEQGWDRKTAGESWSRYIQKVLSA